jgi:phenylacetate-CoA ligase
MNPFYNPIFLSKVLKSYLFDINRLRRLDDQQLQRFQDKKFKKIVEFAYTVPLYYEKYKKAGIHPRDISGLKDIEKLPFITKQDIKKYYPYGIISKNKRKDQLVEVSTSGTTGKSLTIFVDMFDVVMGLFGYLRTIREYDLNWRKSKLTIIGDFAAHTAESGYINKGLQPRVSSNFIFKNIQWLDTNADPKENLEKINEFKPDFIGGYVGMLGHMALLKEQGYGNDVSPKVIAATGSVLDKSLRDYIEQSFQAELYEVYGATETGPIAFECKEGGYHVMSDLLCLEFFNNNEPVSSGGAGKLVVTKLFGGGTPIIRYDAINDIVAPTDKKCTCGLSGDLIEKIYGRTDLSLILPDGMVLMPSAFAEIYSKILHQLKSTKLKDTKIIQKDLHTIEIQVVIDKKQKKGPSEKEIMTLIKEGFEKKVGPDVSILLSRVEKLGDHEARIVSKIKRNLTEVTGYL